MNAEVTVAPLPRLTAGPAAPPTPRGTSERLAAPATAKSELRRELARLRPELFARALRLARSRTGAEDLVQDTLLRALRFEEQYQSGTNLRAWVGQILRTVFLSHCRRIKRERHALDHLLWDPCAWTQGERPEPMACLSPTPARALGSLSAPYQLVVGLVDLEGLSYREAAERLGVPVGTVMSRLHRGRRLLAQLLDEASALPAPTAVAA